MTKYLNPMIIQKDSSPYLYSTDFGGIYLNEYNQLNVDRGIELPLNPSLSSNFNLLSFQMWLRYPESTFESALPIINIIGETFNIEITANPIDNNKRALVESNTELFFYQNGIKVINPVITPNQWNSIYLVLPYPISFSNFAGKIILHPKFVFNNLGEFIYENEITDDIRIEPIVWLEVWKNLSTDSPRDWQSINEYTWRTIQ